MPGQAGYVVSGFELGGLRVADEGHAVRPGGPARRSLTSVLVMLIEGRGGPSIKMRTRCAAAFEGRHPDHPQLGRAGREEQLTTRSAAWLAGREARAGRRLRSVRTRPAALLESAVQRTNGTCSPTWAGWPALWGCWRGSGMETAWQGIDLPLARAVAAVCAGSGLVTALPPMAHAAGRGGYAPRVRPRAGARDCAAPRAGTAGSADLDPGRGHRPAR